jgi:hypothetical protein
VADEADFIVFLCLPLIKKGGYFVHLVNLGRRRFRSLIFLLPAVSLAYDASARKPESPSVSYWNEPRQVTIIEGSEKRICRDYEEYVDSFEYGHRDPYCQRIVDPSPLLKRLDLKPVKDLVSSQHEYHDLLYMMEKSRWRRAFSAGNIESLDQKVRDSVQAKLDRNRISAEATDLPWQGYLAMLRVGAPCFNRDSNTGSPYRVPFLLQPSNSSFVLDESNSMFSDFSEHNYDAFLHNLDVYIDVLLPDYERQRDFFYVYNLREEGLQLSCKLATE